MLDCLEHVWQVICYACAQHVHHVYAVDGASHVGSLLLFALDASVHIHAYLQCELQQGVQLHLQTLFYSL